MEYNIIKYVLIIMIITTIVFVDVTAQVDEVGYLLNQIKNNNVFITQPSEPINSNVIVRGVGVYFDDDSKIAYIWRGIAPDSTGDGTEDIYLSYSRPPFTSWEHVKTPVIPKDVFQGKKNPSVVLVQEQDKTYLYIYYQNYEGNPNGYTSIGVSRVEALHQKIIDPSAYEHLGVAVERSSAGFDSSWVIRPSAIVIQDKLYLYYGGRENNTNIYSAGLAVQDIDKLSELPYYKTTQLKNTTGVLLHPRGPQYYDRDFVIGDMYLLDDTLISIFHYYRNLVGEPEDVRIRPYISTDGVIFTGGEDPSTAPDISLNGSPNHEYFTFGWVYDNKLYFFAEDRSTVKPKLYYTDVSFLIESGSNLDEGFKSTYTTRGVQLLVDGDIFNAAIQPYARVFGPLLPVVYGIIMFTIAGIIYIKAGLSMSIIWSLFAMGTMMPLLDTQMINIGYGLLAAAAAALITKLIIGR